MSIFGRPKKSVSDSEIANFEFGERKETQGPLPIVDNLVEMVQWIEKARKKVTENAADCCLVVVAPKPIDGVAMEPTIAEIANRFAIGLRSYDMIFRHGRDKLILALPHVKPEDAATVLARLGTMVSRLPFRMPDGAEWSVAVALGGVMMDKSPVQETINRADRAMDLARLSGDNVAMWSPELH